MDTNIPEQHKNAINACVRAHPTVQLADLTLLYRVAEEAANGLLIAPNATGIMSSRIEAPDYFVGTATNGKHGWYVQLVKMKSGPRVLLTIGQKWAAEAVDQNGSHVKSIYW